eukprot:TRINITY_DN49634_c0_g1_i1.p1 TRINITY_DN49634_c0_g1~~TRINITY_DN49634_c0_g1_i1.p1  ORF type:complete len:390 (+),score=54.59 TRINITY_DN49634_c0_g1_i1:76-1245(+)
MACLAEEKTAGGGAGCNCVDETPIGNNVELRWTDAGIISHARPRSPVVNFGGTVVGLSALFVALPALTVLAAFSTFSEAVRHVLGFDPKEDEALSKGASAEEITLVLPGTCAFVSWQLGMVQYLCERFDTRGIRLAGVSSGAICAAVILSLEEAAQNEKAGGSPASRVRARAHEIFQLVEKRFAKVTTWPASFIGRLGGVLDECTAECMPSDCNIGDRLRVGVRRFVASPLPAMVPDVITGFKTREELRSAVTASSTVWLVVRLLPVKYVERLRGFCSDGVNPFSYFCFLEGLLHYLKGFLQRTAPRHTYTGLDAIYALWNLGIMRLLLPRNGRHLWVTPTVGGNLKVAHALHISSWYAAEQWRRGYKHALELDTSGYWNPMPRREARN